MTALDLELPVLSSLTKTYKSGNTAVQGVYRVPEEKNSKLIELYRVSHETKQSYLSLEPFRQMFPFCPGKANEHLPFLCNILNPVLTKELPSERSSVAAMERKRCFPGGNRKQKIESWKALKAWASERFGKDEGAKLVKFHGFLSNPGKEKMSLSTFIATAFEIGLETEMSGLPIVKGIVANIPLKVRRMSVGKNSKVDTLLYCDQRSHPILVKREVNGQSAEMLVDTGAKGLYVSEETAREADIGGPKPHTVTVADGRKTDACESGEKVILSFKDTDQTTACITLPEREIQLVYRLQIPEQDHDNRETPDV
ncbi:MAG: uncharacterized protein A8A55_2873 [Amphiamblys sp. WSBS2006]|nr:MAG: uncharacterized protein A8A55_2873 [Amphiamblys sp. WSBS2006]